VISCLLKTARWRFAAANGCGEEPESCGGQQLAAVLLGCACRQNSRLTEWLLCSETAGCHCEVPTEGKHFCIKQLLAGTVSVGVMTSVCLSVRLSTENVQQCDVLWVWNLACHIRGEKWPRVFELRVGRCRVYWGLSDRELRKTAL